jgi:RNA polymerase sigma-70 factor (ECF subfamily)
MPSPARSTTPSAVELDRLLARHQAALRRFVETHAARVVRRRESLSDLVQAVLVELCEALPSLRYEGETRFRHWLYVTARNTLRDRRKYHLRDRRDARREDLRDAWTDVLQHRVTPSVLASSQEAAERIERCLARLSPEHREVIRCRHMAGMSAAEIGAAIGRGEGAARALLSRALARLSSLLAEGGSAAPPRRR